MKHSTKFLLILFLLLQIPSFAQVSGDFRSKSSGDWGNFSIWQVYNGTIWADATSGQIPGGTNESDAKNVYIEAGHTVTLSSDQSCKDLHLNTTSDVVRLNTLNSNLNVWGKMRFYQGTAPGASTPYPVTSNGITGWISTGTQGVIRFRGTANRVIMAQGQVNSNNANSGWNLDFAFDPGFIGEIKDRIRASNITVSSGTLFINNSTGELRIGTNNGASDVTPNGQFLIKSGATVKGGSGIFKKSTVAAENITVESGGNLIIDKSSYVLAAATLNLNGTVTLQNGIKFPTEAGRTSAASVSSFNNLILEGTSDTLQNSITINGRLTLKGTSAINLNTFTVGFGPSGELEYNGSAAQTTTSSEFPSTYGPANLIINNSNGVTLHASRSISSQLTLSSGLLIIGNNDLTLGVSSPAVAGTLSETSMIVTNGTGKVNKLFSAAGSYLYPVGDNTSTAEYSPTTISVNSADLFDGTTFFGIRAINNIHPSAAANTDNLSRYWEVNTNMTNYSYNGTFQYLTADVNGTESNLVSYLFTDETSGASKKAISAVNTANHQIQFTNQNEVGFVSGSNFVCNISGNTINTSNTSICQGQSVTIDATAASVTSGSPSYQWKMSKNGGSWMNVGNSEDYTLSDTASAGQFSFQRIVSDPSNCLATDLSNSIIVTILQTTSIASNPSNVTACANDNVNFAAAGTGTNVKYQWQVSKDGGNFYGNIPASNTYSNVATATLTITSVPASFNGYLYRCAISGTCSTVYTNPASLTINSSNITSQPSNQTICEGLTTSFNVSSSGIGLTYLWQESSDGGSSFHNLSEGGIYSNVISSTLSITPTSAMNNFQYRCSITGSCGPLVISNAASLKVNSSASVISNPTNVTTCANSNLSFSTVGQGTGIRYQWQVSKNGSGLYGNLPNTAPYSNVTTATLNITSVPASYNGYLYRCAIIGTCSTVYTDPALLTISSANLTSQPTSQTICPGLNASFNVGATGNGLTYQWQESSNGGSTFNNLAEGGIFSNVNSASLSISGATVSMNNFQYRCIISAVCGPSVISNGAILKVNSPASIISNPSNVTSCANTNISFSATGFGTGVRYQWQVSKNGGASYGNLPNNAPYSNVATTSLNITSVPASFNGYLYRCAIIGTCSTVYTTPATLTVNSGCKDAAVVFDVPSERTEVVAYPNPFINTITISCNGFEDYVTITVKDLDGRLVFVKESHPVHESLTLGKEFKSGIYVVEIMNNHDFKTVEIIKSE